MDNKQQIHLWYFVAAFLGLVLVQSSGSLARSSKNVRTCS